MSASAKTRVNNYDLDILYVKFCSRKMFKYRIPPIVKTIPSQENFKVENSVQDEMFKYKFCSK
jgi:hypothetical protein